MPAEAAPLLKPVPLVRGAALGLLGGVAHFGPDLGRAVAGQEPGERRSRSQPQQWAGGAGAPLAPKPLQRLLNRVDRGVPGRLQPLLQLAEPLLNVPKG